MGQKRTRQEWSNMCMIAFDISMRGHSKQVDKSGLHYFWHPLRVANQLKGWRLQIVGILHDIIEDTDETLDSLRSQGIDDEEVLDAIYAITKRDDMSYMEYLEAVKANPIARLVKLRDIDDNSSVERLSHLSKNVAVKMITKYHKAMRFLRDIEDNK